MFQVASKSMTTPEQREMLAKAGFVHVTGLWAVGPRGGKFRIGDYRHPKILGKYGIANGKIVIVTPGGEVWLAVAGREGQQPDEAQADCMQVFCGEGGSGAWVPGAQGETIDPDQFAKRRLDPSWQP